MRKTSAVLFVLVFLTLSGLIVSLSLNADSRTIIVPDDFPIIQTAVDHAFAGQTIFVRNGVYPEQHILIDKPLSLVGEDSDNTILVGINNVKYSPPYVIQISADKVKVSGFSITNGSLGGIRVETVGSGTQPTDCEITGNNIINNTGGISTYNGKNLSISNNRISNNRDYGIYVSTSESKIFDNNITENGWVGISVDSSTQVLIFNNDISANGHSGYIEQDRGGVNLRWYGNFDVYANNITNNIGYGVQFGEGCSNSLVYFNNIIGNNFGVKLANFVLTNNSEGIGIGVGSGVYQNNLDNNMNAVIEAAYPYGDINNIVYAIGNGTDVVSWDNGKEGNYWSDYQSNYPNATEVEGMWGIPYVIDENNVDHYPLTQKVNINSAAPTKADNPAQNPNQTQTIIEIVIVAVIVIAMVFVLLLRRYRKTPNLKRLPFQHMVTSTRTLFCFSKKP